MSIDIDVVAAGHQMLDDGAAEFAASSGDDDHVFPPVARAPAGRQFTLGAQSTTR